MVADQKSPGRGIDTRIPLLVIVPVILVAVFVIWGFGSHKHEERIQGEFPVPVGVERVKLLFDVGNLDIAIGSTGKVSFEAKTLRATGSADNLSRAKGSPFTIERVESEDPTTMILRVSPLPEGFAPLPEPAGDAADEDVPRLFLQMDAILNVPVELGVTVEARQANVRVDTRQAATSVLTQAGNVMVQHVAGALRVQNGNGDTIVEQHRGSLEAAVHGQSRFSFVEVTGPVRIVSEQGEVRLNLPRHASVDLDARSLTGNVRNEFGLKSQAISTKGEGVQGKIGDGAHAVSVEAKAGTLTVGITKPV